MIRQYPSMGLTLGVLLTAATCFLASVQPAQAETQPDGTQLGVRYVLTSVWMEEGAATTAMLMPVPARPSGKSMEQKFKTVFGAMRRADTAKYGATSLAFKTNKDTKALDVYVWLDESKATYHPQIIAETVYTFTEMGVSYVQFPKFKLEPLTRKDIEYAAFSLTVAPWQALSLISKHVLTQLSNGARVSTWEFANKLKVGDKIAVETLWGDFERSDKAALEILKAATRLKLSERTPRCLASIESAQTELRVASIDCLVAVKMTKTVRDALTLALKDDPEDSVQAQALSLMQQSSDAELKTIAGLHGLTTGASKTVLKHLDALKSQKGPAVEGAIASLLKHKDDTVYLAAQTALISRSQTNLLTNALKDNGITLQRRLQIATASISSQIGAYDAALFLATAGTEKEWPKLSVFITSQNQSVRLKLLRAAITNAEKTIRLGAITALSREGGRETIDIILALEPKSADEGEALNTVLYALCGQLPTRQLFRDATSNDLRLKGCAIDALSKKSRTNKRVKRKLVPVLKTLSKDASATIRASAIAGLGNLADPKTFGVIKAALSDNESVVVAAGAGALRNFNVREVEGLLSKLSEHPDANVLAQTARSFGVHGYDSGIPIIIGFQNREEKTLRVETTRALVRLIAKGKTIKASFDFFTRRLNDKDPVVRRLALDGFASSSDPRRIDAIAFVVQDADETVQLRAIELLGDSADPNAVEAVSSGLAAENIAVRKTAIVALKKLGGAEASKTLSRHVKRENSPELIKLIKAPK